MDKEKQELIKNIVQEVAHLIGVQDAKKINDKVNQLTDIELEDAMDSLLIAFDRSLGSGQLKREEVLKISEKHLTSLIPEKYPTINSLINRLGWIKAMNMEYMDMPLAENHQIVSKTFDSINSLLGDKFDYFHTGGIMGYFATGKPLERYHSDLDIFINENQLLELKALVDSNPDFKMISSVDTKGDNGHEFSIIYKDSPIDIGIFLFERGKEQEIILKSYYKVDNSLVVDETHLSKEYSDMAFPAGSIKIHNDIPYSTQSVEAVYLSKSGSGRKKDKYDASIIEKDVDMAIVNKMQEENIKTKRKVGIPAGNSIVNLLHAKIEGSEDDKERIN